MRFFRLIPLCASLLQLVVWGCTPTQPPALVRSRASASTWSVEVCGQVGDAEVFVDDMRRTDQCRAAGRRLRCHFRGLRGCWPHRLEVQVLGVGTLRCYAAEPGSKPKCATNGFPRGRERWYGRQKKQSRKSR